MHHKRMADIVQRKKMYWTAQKQVWGKLSPLFVKRYLDDFSVLWDLIHVSCETSARVLFLGSLYQNIQQKQEYFTVVF